MQSLKESRCVLRSILNRKAPGYPRVHSLGNSDSNLLAFPLPASYFTAGALGWSDVNYSAETVAPNASEDTQQQQHQSTVIGSSDSDIHHCTPTSSPEERKAIQQTLQTLFEFGLIGCQTTSIGTPQYILNGREDPADTDDSNNNTEDEDGNIMRLFRSRSRTPEPVFGHFYKQQLARAASGTANGGRAQHYDKAARCPVNTEDPILQYSVAAPTVPEPIIAGGADTLSLASDGESDEDLVPDPHALPIDTLYDLPRRPPRGGAALQPQQQQQQQANPASLDTLEAILAAEEDSDIHSAQQQLCAKYTVTVVRLPKRKPTEQETATAPSQSCAAEGSSSSTAATTTDSKPQLPNPSDFGGVLVIVRFNDPNADFLQLLDKLRIYHDYRQRQKIKENRERPVKAQLKDMMALETGYKCCPPYVSVIDDPDSLLACLCIYRELTGDPPMEGHDDFNEMQRAAAGGAQTDSCQVANGRFNLWYALTLERALYFLDANGADTSGVRLELLDGHNPRYRLRFDESALAYRLGADSFGWNRSTTAGLRYELFPWQEDPMRRHLGDTAGAGSNRQLSFLARHLLGSSALAAQRESQFQADSPVCKLPGNAMPLELNCVLALGRQYMPHTEEVESHKPGPAPWMDLRANLPGAKERWNAWSSKNDNYAKLRASLAHRMLRHFENVIWVPGTSLNMTRGLRAVMRWLQVDNAGIVPAAVSTLEQIEDNLDAWGTYATRFAMQSRYLLLVGTNQRSWNIVHFGPGRDSTRIAFDLHANYAGLGDKAVGKSFLVNTEQRIAVPGTVLSMDNTSAKAFNVDQDLSGVMLINQEGGGALFEPPKVKGEETSNSAMLKQMLDGGQFNYLIKELITNPNNPRGPKIHGQRTIHTNVMMSIAIVSNMGLNKIPPALQTRLFIEEIQGSVQTPLECDNDRYATYPLMEAVMGSDSTPKELAKRLSGLLLTALESKRKSQRHLNVMDLAAAEVPNRLHQEIQNFIVGNRMEQTLVTVAFTLIHLDVLPPISVRLCGLLLPQCFKKLQKLHAMGKPTIRTYEQLVIYARIGCLIDAINAVFCCPTGIHYGKPFELAMMLDLAPLLCVQTSQVCWAFSLLCDAFVSPLSGQVFKGVYHHSALTPWIERLAKQSSLPESADPTETKCRLHQRTVEGLQELSDHWDPEAGLIVKRDTTDVDWNRHFLDVAWRRRTTSEGDTAYDCNYVTITLASNRRASIGEVLANNDHVDTSPENIWSCVNKMSNKRIEVERSFKTVTKQELAINAAIPVALGKKSMALAECTHGSNNTLEWHFCVWGYLAITNINSVKQVLRSVLTAHMGLRPRTVKLGFYTDLSCGELDSLSVTATEIAKAPKTHFKQRSANYTNTATNRHLFSGLQAYQEILAAKAAVAALPSPQPSLDQQQQQQEVPPQCSTHETFWEDLARELPAEYVRFNCDYDDYVMMEFLSSSGMHVRPDPNSNNQEWQYRAPGTASDAWEAIPTHAARLKKTLLERNVRHGRRQPVTPERRPPNQHTQRQQQQPQQTHEDHRGTKRGTRQWDANAVAEDNSSQQQQGLTQVPRTSRFMATIPHHNTTTTTTTRNSDTPPLFLSDSMHLLGDSMLLED